MNIQIMADPTPLVQNSERREANIFYPLDLYGPQNNKSILFTVYKYRKTNIEESEKRTAITSIALPIPNEVSQADAMSYADFEGGFVARQWENLGSSLSGMRDGTSLASKWLEFKGGVTGLAKDLAFSAASGMLGDEFRFFESNLGYTLNPKVGSVFQQVGLRTYEYSFMMLATNQKESNSIRDIVRMFQYHEHPKSGGNYFEFPEVFDISFTPQKIQNYMFKPNICALTGMTVSYNGSSTPTFFKDTGAPVEVGLQLQFKELQIDTKESLDKKYGLGLGEESERETFGPTEDQTEVID